jgi:hypothetical protein
MSQFFVALREDVDRCKASLHDQGAITITGLTPNGEVVAFTGVVQAVEERLDIEGAKRWRITILDSD